MIHTFKIGTKKIIFDEKRRAVAALDNLEGEIFDRISGEDIPPESPSMELRYALAKYDSGALSAAYKKVYGLIADGEGYIAINFGDRIKECALTAEEYEKSAREIYKCARLTLPYDDSVFAISEEDIENFTDADENERRRIECALFLKAVL